MKILVIVAFIFAVAEIITRTYAEFGGRVGRADREEYKKRTDLSYYNGRKFSYPKEWREDGLSEDVRISEKETSPEEDLPVATPDFSGSQDKEKVSVTWFGHSTLLVQMNGKNILVDPIFRDRAFMVQFMGPKRFSRLPVSVDRLPHIDVVLTTHDHYDHLDMGSIKMLNEKTDLFIVPLGIDKHLIRWGIPENKIENMAWWEEKELSELTIICTPSRHTCNRSFDDSKEKLWSSWVLKDEFHQLYAGGDSGYGGHFKEIHKRFGDFDLVMLDDAQYDEMWHDWHMYPEETVMAAKELGAKEAMPIHWGAFVLSSHAWDDPVERYLIAAEKENLSLVTPKLGETVDLDKADDYRERWWKDLR